MCMQGSMYVCVCVHVCVTWREKGRRFLQACSQTLWGCSSFDKRGRDTPSVSVDSVLWKHTRQLCTACDKKSLFPWESNLSRPSCSLNPLIHLFTYRLSPIFVMGSPAAAFHAAGQKCAFLRCCVVFSLLFISKQADWIISCTRCDFKVGLLLLLLLST